MKLTKWVANRNQIYTYRDFRTPDEIQKGATGWRVLFFDLAVSAVGATIKHGISAQPFGSRLDSF
jgi:hypothetical protein